MINELKDEEILNFLMTSDFENEYSPNEFKFLMSKWRYFYRLLFGKYERVKIESSGEIEDLKNKLDDIKKRFDISNTNYQITIADKDNLINSMKFRRLTWKERLSGKIILNEK